MNSQRRWIAVIFLALGIGAATLYFTQRPETPIALGEPAPDFTAVNLATGKNVSLAADYRGQVTLVNIWATWCGPCRQEIPALQQLYKELGPKGLRIAAVSIDTIASDKVSAFMQGFGVTFDVLHDRPGTVQEIYHSEKFPESFLVDKQGHITRIDYGAKEWASDEVKQIITTLLDQKAS